MAVEIDGENVYLFPNCRNIVLRPGSKIYMVKNKDNEYKVGHLETMLLKGGKRPLEGDVPEVAQLHEPQLSPSLFRHIKITEDHPACGKLLGWTRPEGEGLELGKKYNIQLAYIVRNGEIIYNPGPDVKLQRDDEAFFGCEHDFTMNGVAGAKCNCAMLAPRNYPKHLLDARKAIDLQTWKIPDSVPDVVCFGDVLIEGATRCIPLNTLTGLRIVGVSDDAIISV